jgi:hypothetical protein
MRPGRNAAESCSPGSFETDAVTAGIRPVSISLFSGELGGTLEKKVPGLVSSFSDSLSPMTDGGAASLAGDAVTFFESPAGCDDTRATFHRNG